MSGESSSRHQGEQASKKMSCIQDPASATNSSRVPNFPTLTPMYPAIFSDEFSMPFVGSYFPSPFSPLPPGLFVDLNKEEEQQALCPDTLNKPVVRIFSLNDKLRRQIEYYFSEINLSKDVYLRRRMTKEGFLPLSVLGSFPLVRQLTNEMTTIVAAIESSELLELDTDRQSVRPKNNPSIWPLIDKSASASGDKS